MLGNKIETATAVTLIVKKKGQEISREVLDNGKQHNDSDSQG